MVYLAIIAAHLIDPLRLALVALVVFVVFKLEQGHSRWKPLIAGLAAASVVCALALYRPEFPLSVFGRSVLIGMVSNALIAGLFAFVYQQVSANRE